jgi:hypothetical protein
MTQETTINLILEMTGNLTLTDAYNKHSGSLLMGEAQRHYTRIK